MAKPKVTKRPPRAEAKTDLEIARLALRQFLIDAGPYHPLTAGEKRVVAEQVERSIEILEEQARRCGVYVGNELLDGDAAAAAAFRWMMQPVRLYQRQLFGTGADDAIMRLEG
jgi:hypothetical protein